MCCIIYGTDGRTEVISAVNRVASVPVGRWEMINVSGCVCVRWVMVADGAKSLQSAAMSLCLSVCLSVCVWTCRPVR